MSEWQNGEHHKKLVQSGLDLMSEQQAGEKHRLAPSDLRATYHYAWVHDKRQKIDDLAQQIKTNLESVNQNTNNPKEFQVTVSHGSRQIDRGKFRYIVTLHELMQTPKK